MGERTPTVYAYQRTKTVAAVGAILPAGVPTVVVPWRPVPDPDYQLALTVQVTGRGPNTVDIMQLEVSDDAAGVDAWQEIVNLALGAGQSAWIGQQVGRYWRLTLTSALGSTADVQLQTETVRT